LDAYEWGEKQAKEVQWDRPNIEVFDKGKEPKE